jgi:hypothetical protein
LFNDLLGNSQQLAFVIPSPPIVSDATTSSERKKGQEKYQPFPSGGLGSGFCLHNPNPITWGYEKHSAGIGKSGDYRQNSNLKSRIRRDA